MTASVFVIFVTMFLCLRKLRCEYINSMTYFVTSQQRPSKKYSTTHQRFGIVYSFRATSHLQGTRKSFTCVSQCSSSTTECTSPSNLYCIHVLTRKLSMTSLSSLISSVEQYTCLYYRNYQAYNLSAITSITHINI